MAKKLPGYEVRPQQLKMAEAVAAAFDAGEHLLVEAGTGVGKSFAYLIPAIERVTRHGGRVVVSTHTIALQEQLVDKDIPFLRSVFREKFSAVLVKGRSNYIGLRRLARASARQETLFDTKGQRSELSRIESWAYKTKDGSLSDMRRQPSPAVWDRVKSDHDDCLGRRCPHYQRCFYQRARRRALGAQLLIVNHALLLSDLAVRRRGVSFLPDYEYLILDEAHTLERVAGDHLGVSVSNAQIRYLLNTLHNERTGKGVLHTVPGEEIIPVVARTHKAVDDYFAELLAWRGRQNDRNARLREPPPVKQRVSAELRELHERLRELRDMLEDEQDGSELKAAMESCMELAAGIDNWHSQRRPGWVYWLDVGDSRRSRVVLSGRPIDVGPELKESLFDTVCSAVLTSATLTTATDAPFDYIRGRLGMEDAEGLSLGSPFNYREQLTVYVETKMPEPGDATAFVPALCDAIKKYVGKTAGRAFVLFTSYQMMDQCVEALEDFFEEERMPLLVQGSGMPRSLMLENFRMVPHSVLFGTDTFWSGVDVPGEALSNVIIVKLPFAVPNDPTVEARIEQIRAAGGDPFMEFQVPEAVLKFKQGVGRLIRTRSDKGIVVILDPRVSTKRYGRLFLDALPDCEVIVEK